MEGDEASQEDKNDERMVGTLRCNDRGLMMSIVETKSPNKRREAVNDVRSMTNEGTH